MKYFKLLKAIFKASQYHRVIVLSIQFTAKHSEQAEVVWLTFRQGKSQHILLDKMTTYNVL